MRRKCKLPERKKSNRWIELDNFALQPLTPSELPAESCFYLRRMAAFPIHEPEIYIPSLKVCVVYLTCTTQQADTSY